MFRYLSYPQQRDKLLEFLSGRRLALDSVLDTTSKIIKDVKDRGDSAVISYTDRFDNILLSQDNILIDPFDNKNSWDIDSDIKAAIDRAIENITEFHKKQVMSGYSIKGKYGQELGMMVRPLESVGVYVPGGGNTPLVSTLIMCSVPAIIAGVGRIVIATPPQKGERLNRYIGYTAYRLGIREIYLSGGVQGIAALAYGTQSINRVDKIVGPGNIYVNAAKKLVFGDVDIDGIFGPSEIVILADSSANPDWVAADLLSQLEHAGDEMAVLITDSKELVKRVEGSIKKQLEEAKRREVIESSMKNGGLFVIVDSIKEAIECINEIAPEHLEIITEQDINIQKIKNAGCIFVGKYSTEPIGDYIAGSNHSLPTSGSARFFSPLGVYDFYKYTSYIKYTKEAIKQEGKYAMQIAHLEGLLAHSNAIKIRLDDT